MWHGDGSCTGWKSTQPRLSCPPALVLSHLADFQISLQDLKWQVHSSAYQELFSAVYLPANAVCLDVHRKSQLPPGASTSSGLHI